MILFCMPSKKTEKQLAELTIIQLEKDHRKANNEHKKHLAQIASKISPCT